MLLGDSTLPNIPARIALSLVLAALTFFLSSRASAQPFRFMDESGNLHWVDRLDDVPFRFRNQIFKPTPVPTWKGRHPPKVRVPKPKKTPKPKKPQQRHLIKAELLNMKHTPTPAPWLTPDAAPNLESPPPPNPEVPSLPPQAEANSSAAAIESMAPTPFAEPRSIQNEVAFEGAKADASLAVVGKP